MSIASYLSQLLNSSGLVPGTKIASGAIGLSQLTATGSPSASNFLRGDNTWAAAGTGTVTSITAGTGLSGGTITTSGTIALVTTYGAVGTYALLARSTNQNIVAGTSYAGSGLLPAAVTTTGAVTSGTAPSGTWQAMGGGSAGGCAVAATVMIRIA
jgi:hypothetical protein